jgi:hypothetical protein
MTLTTLAALPLLISLTLCCAVLALGILRARRVREDDPYETPVDDAHLPGVVNSPRPRVSSPRGRGTQYKGEL